LIDPAEVIGINHLITEPEDHRHQTEAGKADAVVHLDLMDSELEVGREEDYHSVNNAGIVETLVHTILPHQCQRNNDALWLASVIMQHLASSQAFFEGNKRTAYLTGTLFLIKAQLHEGSKAFYPLLDTELTNVLSQVATRDMRTEKLYEYLDERIED